MIVDQYDTVLLKDGREAAIIEKFSEKDYMADVGDCPKDWDTIKITDVDVLGKTRVLFLDSDLPKYNWNRIVIGGKSYKPIPVYDMKQTVAVDSGSFSVGQEVTFIYET